RGKIRVVGSPALDLLASADMDRSPGDIPGVGDELDPSIPYIVVLQHPVTTEYEATWRQIEQTIEAVRRLRMQTLWFWPNPDAGTDAISGALRRWRETENRSYVRFVKNLPPVEFGRVLRHAACLIGNTSA